MPPSPPAPPLGSYIVGQSLTTQLGRRARARSTRCYLWPSRFPPYWATSSFGFPSSVLLLRALPGLIYGGPSDADNGSPLLCARSTSERREERDASGGMLRHSGSGKGSIPRRPPPAVRFCKAVSFTLRGNRTRPSLLSAGKREERELDYGTLAACTYQLISIRSPLRLPSLPSLSSRR